MVIGLGERGEGRRRGARPQAKLDGVGKHRKQEISLETFIPGYLHITYPNSPVAIARFLIKYTINNWNRHFIRNR